MSEKAINISSKAFYRIYCHATHSPDAFESKIGLQSRDPTMVRTGGGRIAYSWSVTQEFEELGSNKTFEVYSRKRKTNKLLHNVLILISLCMQKNDEREILFE